MLRGAGKSFFPESKAYLGQLSNADFADQPCVVKRYLEEKQRWAVQLLHPRFQGKQILVSEEKLLFDGYAAPPEHQVPLPEHLYEAPAEGCGLALYTSKAMAEGAVVLEESPFMVVNNSGSPVESRWNLYTRTVAEQGASSPVIRALEELSDGGLADRLLPEAAALFRVMVEKSSKPPEVKQMMIGSDEAQELRDGQAARIAGVLARWQANGHAFRPRGEETKEGHSALYRRFSRLLHSCEPNCCRSLCAETGRITVQALRPLRPGEPLAIDYEAKDPNFLQLPLAERRARLLERGFTCACARCLRETAGGG